MHAVEASVGNIQLVGEECSVSLSDTTVSVEDTVGVIGWLFCCKLPSGASLMFLLIHKKTSVEHTIGVTGRVDVRLLCCKPPSGAQPMFLPALEKASEEHTIGVTVRADV